MTTIGRRSFLQRAASAGVALLPRGVRVSQLRSELSLGNEAIGATWAVADGRLRAVGVVDRLGGRALAPPVDVFTLTLADGTLLPSSELRVEAAPRMTHLAGVARAARASERLGGREIVVRLAGPPRPPRAPPGALLPGGAPFPPPEDTPRAAGERLAPPGVPPLG